MDCSIFRPCDFHNKQFAELYLQEHDAEVIQDERNTTLVWKHGFVSIGGIISESESLKRACLFIYYWKYQYIRIDHLMERGLCA